jgi:hypothetical protein
MSSTASVSSPRWAPGRRSATPDSADHPTLEVTSGLHRGVKVALQLSRYRIGGTTGADIVLRDAGVAPEHAVLSMERGQLRLEATGGDIGLADGALLRGHGCRLRPPVDFAVGDARLRVIMAGAPMDSTAAGSAATTVLGWLARRPRAVAAMAVFSIVAALIAAGAWPARIEQPTSEVAADPPINVAALGDITKLGLGPRINAGKEAVPRVEDAVDELAKRIRAAGLNDLKVSTSGERPTVTGTLSRRDAETWASIQQWFDQTYGRYFALGASVSVGDGRPTPALRLQAVWFGTRPYIITADGVRYYEGSVLDTGWVIREIGEDRMSIAKNGESQVLTYR